MRIGQLKHRITFQAVTAAENSLGESVETFSTYKTLWAAIWPVSASEQIRSGQEGMNISHRIRVRYDSGITHGMRITYGSRTFKIRSVINPDEKKAMLDILAVEEL